MTEIEKRVLYYIGYSWNKEEIMRTLNIDKDELERILKKYNTKISKNGVKRAAKEKRIEYAKHNIIIRQDKKMDDCPFICVTVHKQLKTAKKTVYSLSIKDNGKKLRVRSKKLMMILAKRKIRKVEFQWFLHHPLNKFFVTWLLQLFCYKFRKH